jgi:hypothetical protein
LASTLERAVSGIQGAMMAGYQSLAANLQQTAQMMASMNAMMEELVLRSVAVRTRLAPAGDGAVALVAEVANLSKVPLESVHVSLSFAAPGSGEAQDVRVCDLRCGAAVAAAADAAPSELAGLALGAHETLRVTATLRPRRFAQANGALVVSFASPGTGRPLSTRHAFGLYLLHQSRTHVESQAAPLDEGAVRARASLAALRLAFTVPAARALAPGSVLTAEGAERVRVRVERVEADEEHAEVAAEGPWAAQLLREVALLAPH